MGSRANWRRYFARRFSQLRAKQGLGPALAVAPLLLWNALLGEGRDRTWPDESGAAFDAEHGVETRGIISIAALDIDDPNWVHGFDYQAVEVIDLGAVLAPLEIDYPRTTFIDLGAGKGRVVMLAAALPFRRLLGVEISPELARIAIANLARFGPMEHSASEWEIVRGDAAQFEFPADPLVIFMYNPFTHPIMRSVIANLVDAQASDRRRIVVIYVRPELDQMWELAPGFREVARTARYRIYESA